MLRPLTLFLIVSCSVAVVVGQTPDLKPNQSTDTTSTERLRDIPFSNGVSLPFLIKELARDIDLNVLFDPESRLEVRTVRIELKNVTNAEAIKAILLQEGLMYEQAGPKTILVSSRLRGTSLPQLGIGLAHLTSQLSDYFGVPGGMLIVQVYPNTPAEAAGLRAGDVIVELDNSPVQGAVALYHAVNERIGTETGLMIVRDRKAKTIKITPQRGF